MTELPQPLVTPFAPNLYVSFGDQVLNFEEASRDQWLPGPSDDDKRAQWMALLLDPDIQKLSHPHPEAWLVEIDSSFIKFETCPALGAAGEPAAAAGGSAASGAAPEQLKGPRAPLGTTRRALGP